MNFTAGSDAAQSIALTASRMPMQELPPVYGTMELMSNGSDTVCSPMTELMSILRIDEGATATGSSAGIRAPIMPKRSRTSRPNAISEPMKAARRLFRNFIVVRIKVYLTKIRKLAQIRIEIGGIMQAVGNER